MTPIVSTLDDKAMRDLSVYYGGLKPAPPQPGAPAPDAQQVQRGQQLFANGDAARGIPACSGCHGSDARGFPEAGRIDSNGHAPFMVYPALRGQQAQYLQTRLAQYRGGTLRDSTTDFIMNGVAQTVDDDSVQAVAAWLSSLAP
jgi:cytochrome c553